MVIQHIFLLKEERRNWIEITNDTNQKLDETNTTNLFENEFQDAKKYWGDIQQFQRLFPYLENEIADFESVYRAI